MEAIMAPTKKEPSKKVIENSVSTNKENSTAWSISMASFQLRQGKG